MTTFIRKALVPLVPRPNQYQLLTLSDVMLRLIPLSETEVIHCRQGINAKGLKSGHPHSGSKKLATHRQKFTVTSWQW
jgi:hypothetical protein